MCTGLEVVMVIAAIHVQQYDIPQHVAEGTGADMAAIYCHCQFQFDVALLMVLYDAYCTVTARL